MRIVHVITRLILGGAQELVLGTCREQVRLGHDVTLLYGRDDGARGSLVDEARTIPRLHAAEVAGLGPEMTARDHQLAARRLLEVITDSAPDVVHTHTFRAGTLGRAAAHAAGVACIVHTVHGMPFYDEQPRRHRASVRAREQVAARQCHRLICVSPALQARFLSEGIGTRMQYRVCRAGLCHAPYARARGIRRSMREHLGVSDSDVLAGTIARLDRSKGHHDLISGLRELLHRLPFLKLIWVGAGGEHDRLASAVAACGLRGQITLVGAQQPLGVPSYLAAMDLLVHPSYREGYPLALLQALLSGLPVVAYDIEGTRELCHHGQTGLMVPKGDSQALARAIASLVSDPALRARMGACARKHPAVARDDRTMVATLQGIYEETLA